MFVISAEIDGPVDHLLPKEWGEYTRLGSEGRLMGVLLFAYHTCPFLKTPVNFPSMSYLYHHDKKGLAFDLVEDTVISHPETIKVATLSF